MLINGVERCGEALCISFDQGTAELRLSRVVVVQTRLRYVQLSRNVGIAEPVEATHLYEPFRDIQDARGCVKSLVVPRIPSSVQCHRDILSDRVLTTYLLVGQSSSKRN